MKLLITGGAGFIGSNLIHHVIDRPEVEKLVNLDCLTYAGHLENLEKVAAEVNAKGGKAAAFASHLGKSEEVKKMIEQVKAEYKTVDVLVN